MFAQGGRTVVMSEEVMGLGRANGENFSVKHEEV